MNRLLVLGLRGVILAILVASLLFSVGCNQSTDQGQALQKKQQKNEDLQKQLDDQEDQQREDLEKQVADLQKKVDSQQGSSQQSTPQPNQQSDSSGGSPDVVIQNGAISPSQAPEGVVVVSPDFNTSAATTEEASAINGAIGYYQAAEVGDYYTTYSLLSYEDQSNYTEYDWVQANTILDSAAGEFVVTDAYPEDVGNGYSTYAVLVTVYMTDGSSFNRKTYFTNEGGYWGHYLSDEEMNMFNGALV